MDEPALHFRESVIPSDGKLTFEAISRYDGDLKYIELETANWMMFIKMYGGFIDEKKRTHWDWCFIASLSIHGEEQIDSSEIGRNYLHFTMPFCSVVRGQRVRVTIENHDNIAHNIKLRIPLEVLTTAEERNAPPPPPPPRPDIAHYGGRHGHDHSQIQRQKPR
jgi:hypothetical protein